MASSVMGDWYLLIFFGTLGLVMRYAGWPRAPLVLGFILGDIMETAIDITLQNYDWEWLIRPVTAIIAILAILTIVLSFTGYLNRRRESPGVAAGEGAAEGEEADLQKFKLAAVFHHRAGRVYIFGLAGAFVATGGGSACAVVRLSRHRPYRAGYRQRTKGIPENRDRRRSGFHRRPVRHGAAQIDRTREDPAYVWMVRRHRRRHICNRPDVCAAALHSAVSEVLCRRKLEGHADLNIL